MKNIEENFDLVVDLWKNFNLASSMFTRAIGGTSNEVGEFAELLIAKYYKGIKLPASNKSSDIELKDGRKVQVKARKIKSLDVIATKLGVFRSWDFDILVIILFDINGSIIKAIEIDSRTAYQLAKDDQHQNGMSLTTNNELLNHKNAKDITKDLQNMIENKTITCINSIDKQKKETSCSYLNSYQNEKVGQIAQRYLMRLLEEKEIPDNVIKWLQEDDESRNTKEVVHYSKLHLGINYPLLKKVDNKYQEKILRYYKKTIKINNEYFLMCCEWFERSKSDLIKFIEKLKKYPDKK